MCSGGVLQIDATVGVATSITLSAKSASLWRSMEESVEARTILTLAGTRWRKSSRRNELASADVPSLSPRSCCICLSNCVGFLSHPALLHYSVAEVSSVQKQQCV